MPQKLLCRKYSLKFKAVARRCNDRKIQRDGTEKYKFQDMDILNISCSGRVRYFPPSFCVTTYFCEYANRQRSQLAEIWTDEEINHALEKGIVHYNGLSHGIAGALILTYGGKLIESPRFMIKENILSFSIPKWTFLTH